MFGFKRVLKIPRNIINIKLTEKAVVRKIVTHSKMVAKINL